LNFYWLSVDLGIWLFEVPELGICVPFELGMNAKLKPLK